MELVKQVFERQILPAGTAVRDARFVQCAFLDCACNPSAFSSVENSVFERTRLKSKLVTNIALRQVTIDTCKGNPMFRLTNGLFDRVTLRGDFGAWMITQLPEFLPAAQAGFAVRFYDTVDWALDISQARFKNLTLRGVPADKVRRDPERQAAVRKDRLLADPSWRDDPDAGLVAVLKATLDRPAEGEILSINDLSTNADRWRERLRRLRAAGLVD